MTHPKKNAPAKPTQPVMLVILDGFGFSQTLDDNAVALANTPHFDNLRKNNSHAFLKTCGEDVGLPEGQMGNSEVGHLNIGAGRVVMQELPRINRALQDGSLKHSDALRQTIDALKKTGGKCHLMGLISDGGVHAHQDHVIALATLITQAGVPVVLHVFTDGRDTPPQSGADFLTDLLNKLPTKAQIATVTGRYFAMDRDNRWDRVQRAYNALAHGKGLNAENIGKILPESYEKGVTDEFLEPTVLSSYQGMNDGDGILSANFRADRIRQLLNALLLPDFNGFDRGRPVKFAVSCAMTPYSADLAPYMHVLFPKQPMVDLLGDVVSRAGFTQLRMAETEKYPHVTYFLNGGREDIFEGEERIMIASPHVATYDLQPEMSAPELTDRAVEAIESGKFSLIVLNFANPDMVGHTGVLKAAIKACETVDTCLGRIVQALDKKKGALIVTADHGNCETMRDPETGEVHTAHTLNLVPVILSGRQDVKSLRDGRLADLAPTILSLLGLNQPEAMTGQTLIAS